MKKKLLGFALAAAAIFAVQQAQAQTANGFVGIGTTSPKARLDIVSDTSGILVPRYATKAAADAILTKLNATDHKGMMVFVAETANQGFWYYSGTAWVKVGGASSGSTAPNFLTKSANYTITTSDVSSDLILVNTKDSIVAFTLPSASAAGTGKKISITGVSRTYYQSLNLICGGTDTFLGVYTPSGSTNIHTVLGSYISWIELISDGVSKWYITGLYY